MHFCANYICTKMHCTEKSTEKITLNLQFFNGQFLDTPGTNFSPCTDNKHEGKFQIVLVSF